MTIYVLLAAFYSFLSIFEKKINSSNSNKLERYLYCAILLAPMFILVAFRHYTIGSDTHSYYDIFYRMTSADGVVGALRASLNMEDGFLLLNYFFNLIGFSYYGFQFVVSLFIFISLSVFIYRYSNNYSLSCVVFLCMRFMFGTMNQVRMWISIGVLLWSFPYLLKKKIIPFILIVLLASLFHLSCLIFLLIFPISLLKNNKRNVILFIAVALVLFLLGDRLFYFLSSKTGLYTEYMRASTFDVSNNIAIYFSFFVLLIFFLFSVYASMHKKDAIIVNEDLSRMNNVYFWTLLILVGLALLGLNVKIMSRITAYYEILLVIILPYYIKILKNKRQLFIICFDIFLVAQLITILILRPNWYCVTPYLFYFI